MITSDKWRRVGLVIMWIIPRLSILMLGIASMYGVYRFMLVFFPEWVAKLTAASMEGVYIGLAIANVPKQHQHEAKLVSIGAVVTAVMYLFTDGFIHLTGIDYVEVFKINIDNIGTKEPITVLPIGWVILLCIIHAIPLPVLAYRMSVLILHPDVTMSNPLEVHTEKSTHNRSGSKSGTSGDDIENTHETGRNEEYTKETVLLHMQNGITTRKELLETMGCSGTTLDRKIDELVQDKLVEKVGRGQYMLV